MTNEKKLRSNILRWALSFLVPFFIVGVASGYHWFHYQWEDISWRHPGAFDHADPNSPESLKSCWSSGIDFGLLFGVPAGLLGLCGYASTFLVRRWRGKQSAESATTLQNSAAAGAERHDAQL